MHSERRYTFVVDYGQNMELPVYNKEQPDIMYYYKWKQLYPHLKVSRPPAEDICQYCYAFCNCHRYLANHSLFGVGGDGNKDEEELIINLE